MSTHAGHQHGQPEDQARALDAHGHGEGTAGHGAAGHEDRHEHEHAGHDHGHGSSAWSRAWHGVSEVLGAHSHDAADQVDETLEADADGRRALLLSLLVLAVTAAVQAAVVLLSGSVALLRDTLHNLA